MPRPTPALHIDRVSEIAALMVCGVAAVVLAGWTFGLDALKTLYGPITMKTNAALGLLLCGAALWLRLRGMLDRTSALCAAAGGGLGALTLFEHVSGVDLGIDQWLFTELPGAAATISPNRMGPHGAISLMLAAKALLALQRGTVRAGTVAQICSSIGGAFALMAIVGYSYGAVELYGIARYTGIALPTAVALLILHAGIVFSSGRGVAAMLGDEGPAGTLVRRLTLPVVGLPLVIGYLMLKGREAELLDRGLAFAFFAVVVIVVLLGMLWRTAATIAATNAARQRAHDAAARANQLKDQFIAVLSHELRTPLNVMLGRLRVLEGQADDATRLRAAAIAARNGRLLARLVEDLLDLSRATSGHVELAQSPTDLNALIRGAMDAAAADAAARSIAITSTLDGGIPLVHVDSLRMQQVLGNLLSNALKFTPAGGRIDVRTTLGEHVTITVADTGIGFDAEFAPYLFEPFRQADASTRREHGGLGLGLSIARHLVALHGGSIDAWSAGRGRGATFTITLPRTPIVDADGTALAPAATISRRDGMQVSSG